MLRFGINTRSCALSLTGVQTRPFAKAALPDDAWMVHATGSAKRPITEAPKAPEKSMLQHPEDRIGLLRRRLAVFAHRLLTQFPFVFLKLLTFPRLVFSLTRNFLSLFLAQLECLTRLFPQSITLRRRFCGVLRGKQGMWLLAWGSKFSTACLEALMRSLVLRGAIEDATPTRQTQSQA